MIIIKLEKINIDLIKPYNKNPRNNNDAVEIIIKSIKQCEYISPIILDENNIILAGHTRFKALKKLGYKEVECIIKIGLTEKQKKKYRILDNKTSEIAKWDYEILKDELKDLDFEDLDLDLDWGLNNLYDFEENSKESIEDDYEENLPLEAKSKYGDIYQLGNHRLMCGDSTNENDISKLMNGKIADMILTDPPYNINYEGKTYKKLKIQNDNMNKSQFKEFLINVFSKIDNFLKPGGIFYIWHADSDGYTFRKACIDIGWQIRQNLIWNKSCFTLGRQDYQWKHEPCLYGWKDGGSHFWGGTENKLLY